MVPYVPEKFCFADASDGDIIPPGSYSSAIGGIPSDVDGGDEGAYAATNTEIVKLARAKVISIAASSRPMLLVSLALRRISIQDQIHAAAAAVVGNLKGWSDPSAEDVVENWNCTFQDNAVSKRDPRDNELVVVITKLVRVRFLSVGKFAHSLVHLGPGQGDGWRNKLGVAGISSCQAVFKGKFKEQIVDDVKFYLEGTDRSRVFYYWEIVEDPETGGVKHKGMFQSSVFSKVLAVHCNGTAMGDKLGPLGFSPSDPTTTPDGALTIACHAASPSFGNLGKFSKTNWADHLDFTEAVQKLVPSTSAIAPVVKKLSLAQWSKIIVAAQAAAVGKNDIPEADVIDVDTVALDEDLDLVNDDSDA
ncbi:hypothetical protein B0H13DRAFT_1902771 [Mycena leptocephala]|nr:hypothetical protein B0H13DRAFT_1902771 [Mycena leptocephala]